MKIDWIARTRKPSTEECDIYITINKPGKNNKSERVRIRFSEGIHSICFDSEKRLLVGIAGDRLYFKPTNATDGYQISMIANRSNGLRNRAVWVVNQKLADFIHKNPTITQAKLLYDEKQKLYYIEAKGKAA